jgi:hypothetical protein
MEHDQRYLPNLPIPNWCSISNGGFLAPERLASQPSMASIRSTSSRPNRVMAVLRVAPRQTLGEVAPIVSS